MRPCTCSSGFQWRFNALILRFCTTLFQTTHQTNSHSQLFLSHLFLALWFFTPYGIKKDFKKNNNNNNNINFNRRTVHKLEQYCTVFCND